MNVLARLGACAFAFALANTSTMAAEHIDCVDSGYIAEDQATLDGYIDGFTIEAWGAGGPPSNVMTIIAARVRTCGASNGWSLDAMQDALLYKVASVGMAGVESASPLSAEQFAQLDDAMTPDDKVEIAKIFDSMRQAQAEGRIYEAPKQSPEMFIGRLILRSGIPASPENSRWAGGWLAVKTLQDQRRAKFAQH